MLLQILNRYVSVNQIAVRFLIDLLSRVLEIYKQFFVLNFFRLINF